MKYTVFDTADDCTSKIAALKKAGITAIIRYGDTAFAKSIREAGYKVGCYGSGYTCNQLLAEGTYDIWQVFGLCDLIYQGRSIETI